MEIGIRYCIRMILVFVATVTVVSVEGVDVPLSGTDILVGRSFSDFICRNAAHETVAETFSLTNGVLTCQLELRRVCQTYYQSIPKYGTVITKTEYSMVWYCYCLTYLL